MRKKIGKYVVLGRLGSGGMGSVYKALVPGLDRLVAVKVLEPAEILADVVGREELERRFLREARTMAALNHPRVAQVWDLGRDRAGRLYFVMEFLCNNLGLTIGETFRAEDVSRILPLERAVRYAMETLDALARLHHAGVVHRDVKPPNLLLTEEDGVKLIDFGLATAKDEGASSPPGERVGSPYYAAPEQEEHPAKADERSDLYSVGVMLHRMLTGRLPDGNADNPGAYNPDLGPDWESFLDRSCAAEPDSRFDSAEAMRGELSGLFEDWRARLEQACALEDMQPPGRSYGPVADEVRSESAEVEEEDAREAFGLDELWRPSAYCACEFEDLGDGSVRDAANGLVWQKSGAPYPLSLEEAGDYLEKLNQESFAGRSNWRLPTVPEAKLLLTPVRHREELCIQPVFDSRQRRLWTADTGSGATAWFADADLGFIAALDAGCRLHLRAVCDMQEDES